MDGATRNCSEISTTSSIPSSHKRAASFRTVSINPTTCSNFQNDPQERCHHDESASHIPTSRLGEKSVLPISVTNSPDPRRQTSDTSTQIFSLNSSISEPVCRICHGTSNVEQLMSLCYCAGSIGLMHVSCLQRWLGSSNKTRCELCHFKFAMERKPKPLHVYFCNPGSKDDKRRLLFDAACIGLLSPTTLTVVSLCIYGATRYSPHRAEFVGLFGLGSLLLALFIVWLVICLRINLKKWQEWKQFNQTVKLRCSPPEDEPAPTAGKNDPNSQSAGIDMPRKGSQMGVKISSIEIKVITEGQPSGNTDRRPLRTDVDSLQKDSRKSMNSISRPLLQAFNTNTPGTLAGHSPGRPPDDNGRDQVIYNYYISPSSSKESASTRHRGYSVPPYSWNDGGASPKERLYRASPTERRDSSESRQNVYRDSSLPSGEFNRVSGSHSKPSYPPYSGKNGGFSHYDSSLIYPQERYI